MRRLTLLIAALALTASAPASRVIYQTGFDTGESVTWTAGASIESVDNWSVLAGDAKVTASDAHAGDQAVELAANTVINRDISSSENIVWVRGWFKGAGSTGTPDFPPTPLASAIIFFGSTGIQAWNGDGNGGAGNGFVATGESLSAATWTQVMLRLNYASKNYDVYVNNARTNQGLGFRDNLTALQGFQNLASETSFFDSFAVVERVVFDANGDGAINVADLVTIVNEIASAGTITNPIYRDNADHNSDGAIDATDRTALANSLLGL